MLDRKRKNRGLPIASGGAETSEPFGTRGNVFCPSDIDTEGEHPVKARFEDAHKLPKPRKNSLLKGLHDDEGN